MTVPQENSTTTTVVPDTGAPAAPSTEPSVADISSEAGFDFAGLATHDDDVEAAVTTPVTTPATPAAATPTPSSAGAVSTPVAPTAVQPQGTPPVVASTSVVPVVQPSPPVAAQPQGQPTPAAPTTPATAAAAPAASLEQIDFAKHRETYLPKLRDLYKLTDEKQIEKLRTNPEEVLPELAANLHYEVQLAAISTVLQALPTFIDSMMGQRTAQDKANDAFYSKWPKLKEHVAANPAAEESIRQSIRAYRNANSAAPMDDVIAKAGLLAMVSLGIPLETAVQLATTQAAAGQPAIAPVAPVPSLAPRPAGVGATGHVPQRQPGADGDAGNIFEDLANAYLSGEI